VTYQSKTPQSQPAWLIDSSIYVFKAWYTYPEKTDSEGNPINAVCGFLDFVYDLLSAEKPQRIAFAFDESLKSSYRKTIYPDYKANRSPAPEALRRQFQYCRQFLKALGIYEAASLYYEADDLIGTWAKKLRQQNIPVNIITADKDLAQLIHEKDHWWEYQRGQCLDSKAITKKFRAKPRQIADQLAIAGDKSDNIPGVPGIGMSTAGKLLKRFDNLDSLFASIPEISSMQIRGAVRIQQLIKEHQGTIKLARKLTEIQCDIEEGRMARFRILGLNKALLKELFVSLDFSNDYLEKWIKLHNMLRQNALHD